MASAEILDNSKTNSQNTFHRFDAVLKAMMLIKIQTDCDDRFVSNGGGM